MSDQAAANTQAYHRAADSIERTNRSLRRLLLAAVSFLLAAALVVIVTAELRFETQIQVIKSRQLQFHEDSTCQTAALDRILTELAAQRAATESHRPVPPFIIPAPC